MNEMNVGIFKRDFSKVIEAVKSGESYTILYGKSAKPVAIISPYKEQTKPDIRIFSKSFTFIEAEHSKISEEEFLNL